MPCDSPQNQKFCSRFYNCIPACLEVNKGNRHSSALSSWVDPEERGILVKLFELKDILLQHNKVNFSAKGFCMYPIIQPADKLCVELKKAEQIKVGEVAVYRRNNNLFAHRTIDKGIDNGLHYIITCPDNSGYGNDGIIFDDNIIGIVSAIERKGRVYSVERKTYSLTKKIYLEIFFAALKFKWIATITCLYMLAFLQQFSICRRIFQLFSPTTKGLKFSISVPLNNNVNSLFNTSVSSEGLAKLIQQESEYKVLKWALFVNTESKVVANLSFVFKPKNCFFSGWWISEVKIMPQYWGSWIEEKIFQRADESLKILGASSIFTSFFKKDYLSRMLFQRVGFKESHTYKNSSSICNRKPSNTRIVLERKIKISPTT